MTALSSRRSDVGGASRLVDVAHAAGVSLKTASRVMNGSDAVSDTVRERVQAAARELAYVPNLPARRLSSGRMMKWVYGAIIAYTLVTVISLLLPRGVVVADMNMDGRPDIVVNSDLADTVSVLARVSDREASVFVRDRGRGFDRDAVPRDRAGLRDSIVGRMARQGLRTDQ